MAGKSPLEHDSGVASGSRENMTGPQQPRVTENRLHDVDLESRGEFIADAQRDRDSNGTGEYDDSIATRRGNEDARDRRGVARGD